MNEKLIFWLFVLIFILSCLTVCFFLKAESAETAVIVTPLYASQAVTENNSDTEDNSDAENNLGIQAQTQERAAKININTASKEQLMTLSGIGDVISDNIIAYRAENGDFFSVEEIMEVSGIGEAKFNNIKDYICV